MSRIGFFVFTLVLATSSLAAQTPTGLRCEWRVNPTDVPDPCPELYWEAESQTAYRVQVARSQDDLAEGKDLVWDSGRVETELPIAEYAGPELRNAATYWWHVSVWDAEGRLMPVSVPQTFRMQVRAKPHHLPTIRTFMNFGGNAEFARDWLDLSFRKEAKSLRESVLVTPYGLICTLVLPHPSTGEPLSGKAQALADYCVEKKLTNEGILEDMFCHFSEDTNVTLHGGAERAANPLENRKCPGWDPANDRNGDGRVDDQEAARLTNSKATARRPEQARIPIYFWGPPQDDFVMKWFEAMRTDLGEPLGPYYLLEELDAADDVGAANLLPNGGFEQIDTDNNPVGWTIAKPIALDREVKRSAAASMRITSESRSINNINKVSVQLKPNTSYTLIAWAKTDNVSGAPGAQVYPYDFEGASSGNMMTWTGTEDWKEQRLVLQTGDDGEGRINLRMYGASGTVWFDDVRLLEGIAVRRQVFARNYSKGLVLVKPYVGGSFGDDTATVHKLLESLRPLRADGTVDDPVREVVLRNAEAVVLLK